MEYMDSLESAIWMVIMGIVTGLLSKFLVEILWRKYMKSWANEVRGKICNKKERIYAIIQEMKKVYLPAPDWDKDLTINSPPC